ncbi:MAG: DUF2231 domain-containing protein [Dehalococcoidia bacterium]|nr:DUF2231 domain-containing protein [Dehalococcoidia bacterium]
MHAKVHYFGNPLHAAMIALPAGMYVGTLVFDLFYLFDSDPVWFRIAQYMLMLGIVGALAAAIPGAIDYLFIPAQWRAKTWAMTHALLNLGGTALAIVSAVIRWGPVPDSGSGEMWAARLLAWAGIAIAMGAASIGGHLVYKLNIGDANAPHSDTASLTPARTAGEDPRGHDVGAGQPR